MYECGERAAAFTLHQTKLSKNSFRFDKSGKKNPKNPAIILFLNSRSSEWAHVSIHPVWAPTFWPLLYFYPPVVCKRDKLTVFSPLPHCALRSCSTSKGSFLLVSIVSAGSLLTFNSRGRGPVQQLRQFPPQGKEKGEQKDWQTKNKLASN